MNLIGYKLMTTQPNGHGVACSSVFMTIMSEDDTKRQAAEAHKLRGNELFKGSPSRPL